MDNPYFDLSFFPFLTEFLFRMLKFLSLQISFDAIAPDEIQIFVLGLIGASASLIGSFLVLRKMTMLANSISHTILLGIVIAFLFGSSLSQMQEGQLNIPLLLLASFAVGLGTAFLTEFLTKLGRLQEDASTGLVFTTLFALGIVLVNLLTRNAHLGAEVVMGNVDALHRDDLFLALVIFIANLSLITVFYKEWQLTTFDPGFAKALGFSPAFFNTLLMALVSMSVVGAFRAVGVLMVLTFMTAPPLTARLYCKRLSSMLVISVTIALFSSLIGVALSRHLLTEWGLALSTGALVTTILGSVYLLCAFRELLQVKRSKQWLQ